MQAAFATIAGVEVVEQYVGTSSTDFWGISFAFSSIDHQVMSGEALEYELTLMRACWTFFDAVRARVRSNAALSRRRGDARLGPAAAAVSRRATGPARGRTAPPRDR
jgi:hypothetical protein